ncbi:MAG TPA: polysaccharide lyase family protein [Planctomycetota bacterium]|jgi:hypothetical protein
MQRVNFICSLRTLRSLCLCVEVVLFSLVLSLRAAEPEPKTLWEIGKADGKNAEFALAPSDYEKFQDDGFFIAGQSDPKRDWPYVHPGPADDWGGSREHTFTIWFGVKTAGRDAAQLPAGTPALPVAGNCRVLIDLIDTHFKQPPKIRIEIGGQKFEKQLQPGAGNESIEGDPSKGKAQHVEFELPASALKAGNNRLDITTTGGSWLLYDRVALEVPKEVEATAVENVSKPKPAQQSVVEGPAHILIDCEKVINTMRGGIGASWHAIEEPIPIGHGGSGWGGYPPAEDEAAWAQIDRHARWLGLDWNRVEIEQRIYEPERNQFTFDSAEMKILYRILDWCEKNKSDVFFQQMWSNVKWLAFPEFRDDPIKRVHSAPASMEDFGEGLASVVEHLVKKKGYTCIRSVCITNEPGYDWSWWTEPPKKAAPLRPGLAVVRKALDARGISIPLSGPDMTDTVPALDPKRFDYLDLLGAYDFHSYGENFDWKTKGQMVRLDKNTADWCAFAHKQGKPFFMSEFGTMPNGWGGDKPGPACFDSILKDAELVVRRINCGVDGFNRWSFLNRGDLDGAWQFVETWDRKQKRLLKEYTPRANTYFGLGLLTRFTAKHSEVLDCKVEGGKSGQFQRLFAAALRSPKGNLTLAIVNDAANSIEISADLRGLAKDAKLYRYSFSSKQKELADVKVEAEGEFALTATAATLKDRIEATSITVYSTYKLAHGDDGVIAE